MFFQLTILGLAALAAGHPMSSPNFVLNPFTPNGRIVGGEPTTIEKVPHQVSLQVSGFGFCGGSIVDTHWVATAGHCLAYPADMITIRAGTTTKSNGGSLHQVENTIRHEDYRTNKYGIPENDIALIKVATPFEFDSTRQPISLFRLNEESPEGVHAVITGWGAIREGGSTPDVLQTVEVPIVNKRSCSEAYKAYGGVPAGQICAAYPEGGKDACQGDSGGPLAIDGRLAGIVSWGNGCARKGYPGVYTEVASYRDWMESKMRN